jgi:hypothetical protein
MAILFLSLVLVSACAQKAPTTTTTVNPEALQEAEQQLEAEVESAVENITTTDIENAITGAAIEDK